MTSISYDRSVPRCPICPVVRLSSRNFYVNCHNSKIRFERHLLQLQFLFFSSNFFFFLFLSFFYFFIIRFFGFIFRFTRFTSPTKVTFKLLISQIVKLYFGESESSIQLQSLHSKNQKFFFFFYFSLFFSVSPQFVYFSIHICFYVSGRRYLLSLYHLFLSLRDAPQTNGRRFM